MVVSFLAVWDIADTFNGLMAIPNSSPCLPHPSGVVAKLTKEGFFDKKQTEKIKLKPAGRLNRPAGHLCEREKRMQQLQIGGSTVISKVITIL